MNVTMEQGWKEALKDQFEQEYFVTLTSFVKEQYTNKRIYPEPKNIFRAFDLCPLDQVKVVILGQDPYHGEGQANGLSFAVNTGISIPPSLQNIFKEIESDMGYKSLRDGDLSRWAKQGVLLLNSVLTVQSGLPASHKKQGWETFTDAVIQILATQKQHVVYFLWGNYAKQKGGVIPKETNLVLESGHPSPFSAQLFHGNHQFSLCNEYLIDHTQTPIDWH
jgi:uracil-DNA glycosylase